MNPGISFRLFIFILLFLILSGVFGPSIVASRLLYSFYFYIYGNMGKIILFIVLSFFVMTGRKVFSLTLSPIDKKSFIFLLISLLLILIFPVLKTELLEYDDFYANIPLSLTVHLVVVLIPVFLTLGIFGTRFIKNVIKTFQKKLYICIFMSVLLYFSIFKVWSLWPYLSDIVLTGVKFLFSLTHKNVVVFPPRVLFVEKFAVSIDQACSGLESILFFSGLSFLIWFTDRKKLHSGRFSLFFIMGLAGTFMVNILRVYVIIWSGLLFSPKISAVLFHTYLGMVFFLAYFTLLLKLTYKHLLRS